MVPWPPSPPHRRHRHRRPGHGFRSLAADPTSGGQHVFRLILWRRVGDWDLCVEETADRELCTQKTIKGMRMIWHLYEPSSYTILERPGSQAVPK